MRMLCDQFEVHSFPKGMLAKAGEAEVADVISAIKPDVILHTAAISDTGYSEAHPEESYRANVSLPVWMARGAMLSGAKLVCFSSDQVYTGLADNGPFAEDVSLHPANVYGRHKLEAEQRVLDISPDAVMLRATWMYDFPCCDLPTHVNLLVRMMRAASCGESLSFSDADYRGITYVRHAIAALPTVFSLIGGVYNFGSENAENMVLTARQFAETLGITVDIQEADWARNLAMDCSKLQAHGIVFDTTQAGLTRCLRDYGLL